MDAQVKQSVEAVEETVGQQLMRALYDEVTNIRIPWSVMPQQQQQELLDRLRAQVDTAVSGAVRRIATGGFSSIAARIDSLTIKDDAKAVLLLARGSEALHELSDRVGSTAVVVFADASEYTDGMQVFTAQADQPDLPLQDEG